MSNLETLLEGPLRSELIFQQQRKALGAFRKQLQETTRQHRQNLDKRIYQDALLSKHKVFSDSTQHTDHARFFSLLLSGKKSIDWKSLCSVFLKTFTFSRNEFMRSSTFKSPLTQDIVSSNKPSENFSSSSPAKISSEHPTHCSVKAPTESQHCVRMDSPKTTQMRREEEDEAECQRKFCALPVPSHVTQPLFEQMMELREMDRKQGHRERKEFLLSIQKPFSFQEREKEKREKLVTLLKQVSLDHERDASPDKEGKDSPHPKVKGRHPRVVPSEF